MKSSVRYIRTADSSFMPDNAESYMGPRPLENQEQLLDLVNAAM